MNARLAKRLGEFALDAELEAPQGTVLVLVGESGSGKTTLLRLLAGLARPDRGRIELDGELLLDSESGVDVPTEARPIGWVAQDYALFPHLSVFENVAFGLRAQRLSAGTLVSRVERALEPLGLPDLAARMPRQLSGGQKQRVAIARALVLEPRLLLLDEPLSALDLNTRRSVRAELRRLLAGLPCTTVFVTHSPAEALAFGDRIAVLESGRITQQGPRAELLRQPRSPYIAAFLGVNLVRGTVAERQTGALARVRAGGGELHVPDPGRDGDVSFVIQPRAITISLEPPAGSARNVFRGAIQEIAPEPPLGEQVRVFVASDPPLVAEITRDAAESLLLAPGTFVHASFKATGVSLVD